MRGQHACTRCQLPMGLPGKARSSVSELTGVGRRGPSTRSMASLIMREQAHSPRVVSVDVSGADEHSHVA